MNSVSDISIENAPPVAIGTAPIAQSKRHRHAHGNCQNCGAALTGAFCHACGQHGHVHRSVFHVIEEVLHGITHLDSRAWRSIPMLAFRPGTLTRNYVMGKRARYVPPFAMFLFSIFTMFLVFALSGGPGLVASVPTTKAEAIAEAREALRDRESDLREAHGEVRDAQAELASVQADSEASPAAIGALTGVLGAAQGQVSAEQAKVDQAKAAVARAIAAPESEGAKATPAVKPSGSDQVANAETSPSFKTQADKDTALAEITAEKVKATLDGNPVAVSALALAERVARATPVVAAAPVSKAKAASNDQAKANIDLEVGATKIDVELGERDDILNMLKASMRRGDFIVTPWPALNKKIKHKTENPDLFLYKLQNTAYKFSFLLVPLSLPFIWIMLFWKKNVTLFDHAVFSLYSLSFVSFLFILISLGARFAPVGQLLGLAAIAMPIHIFFQFKGAYQLKWFSALWRTILFCSVFSWVVLAAFLLSIVALGVTG